MPVHTPPQSSSPTAAPGQRVVQANVSAGGPRQRPQEAGASTPATAPAQGGGGGQQPQRPGAPGGGALRQPLFSGDHVLETVASGQVYLHPGAQGPAIRAIQQFLLAQGLDIGPSGADGQWGPRTTSALKAWQVTHGVPATGVFGRLTLAAMDQEPAVTSAPTTARPAAERPAGTRRAPSSTTAPEGQTQAQAQGGNQPRDGAPGSKNGGLPGDFQKVWDAHPHNYQKDSGQNKSSSDLLVQQGWSPDAYSNTCAIRLSIMLNTVGGGLTITKEKAKAAGLDPGRVPFSKKTGWYYILSAKEMWTYLSKYAGPPSMEWPAGGRFKSEGEFKTEFSSKIEPVVSGKRGIVAFDKIFGFSGTGHVDVFDGTHLSDAPNWYPSQALKVWYI